jgi:uncharacterized SAM-binding protein YcdF (DUF218 family)
LSVIDVLGGISHPLSEACAIGAIGIAALVFKRRRSGLALIAAAAAWAYLCATPAFALILYRGLAHPYPPKPPADYPRADAIVLVGGGPIPRPLQTWNAKDDPALATPLGFAVALYRHGKAPVIAGVGGSATATFARALRHQNLASPHLLLVPGSHTTHEDATFTRRALPPRAAPVILLVGTGLHMPRTLASFRKQGYRPIPAPALQPAWIAGMPHAWLPHRGMWFFSRASLHEYIGLLYYRLRGWATW